MEMFLWLTGPVAIMSSFAMVTSPPVAMDLLLYSDQQQFSRDVDEKANAYFQAIYNRGMSVDRLLDILKQFKDSANKKERVSTETISRAVLLQCAMLQSAIGQFPRV